MKQEEEERVILAAFERAKREALEAKDDETFSRKMNGAVQQILLLGASKGILRERWQLEEGITPDSPEAGAIWEQLDEIRKEVERREEQEDYIDFSFDSILDVDGNEIYNYTVFWHPRRSSGDE
jgi:hypothetical protein